MKTLIKLVVISAQLVLVTSFAVLVYNLVTRRGFNFRNIFNTNFFVGMLIICVGLVVLIAPTRIDRLDKLTDHTTYIQRNVEMREQKQGKAYEFIFLGIMMIIVTGLIQLLLWAIIR